MSNDFPRILTLLRKEKGISQKQAAEELGVAQALLSHYEKGKRECGLEFLLKAAEYYNVSTDYLLGRSPVANGALITHSTIEEAESPDKAKNLSADELAAVFAKKLVNNSVDVIYSLLGKTKNPQLTDKIYDIFSCAVYRAFRLIYKGNPANDVNMFKTPEEGVGQLISAAEAIATAKAELSVAAPEAVGPVIKRSELEAEYGKSASVLLNMVMHCEKQIEKL
ncbi:MAG: helix-turn-helix domain-containing protein [Ruminococcaceae bacterium]|nr:helix-turn-helix domain-containing protein [Oscillospiraceae bacterium]